MDSVSSTDYHVATGGTGVRAPVAAAPPPLSPTKASGGGAGFVALNIPPEIANPRREGRVDGVRRQAGAAVTTLATTSRSDAVPRAGTADGFFRGRTVFDPPTIVAQICCCQATTYLTLCALLYVLAAQRGFKLSLDLIFDWTLARLESGRADVIAIATLLNTTCNGALLRVVVARTKQCLDFSATQHLIHLIAVCVYSKSFPSSWVWWILLFASLALSTLMGEYLCMMYELQDIPTAAPPSATSSRPVTKVTEGVSGAAVVGGGLFAGGSTSGSGNGSLDAKKGIGSEQGASRGLGLGSGSKVPSVPRTGSGPEGGSIVVEQVVTASSVATHRRTQSRSGTFPILEAQQQK